MKTKHPFSSTSILEVIRSRSGFFICPVYYFRRCTITLGEALSLRAKQAQRLNDLQGRIKASALHQEGTKPPEEPYALIEEYLKVSKEHAELLRRIAVTNVTTDVDGSPLMMLLHKRESFIRKRNIYGIAAKAASPGTDSYRYMRTELKYESSLDVAEMRRKEDEANEKVRELDAQIQKSNWATELL